jgi:long-chain fatty acid transport protein
MSNVRNCLKFGFAVTVLSSAAGSAMAGGFDLPDQDAFAVARGLAFVATADNPSAIFYNPAGMTQLKGNNLRLGAYNIDLVPSYQAPGGGTTFHNEKPFSTVPQFYYTYTPEDFPVSFGLGVYAPDGLSVSWPQNTGFRSVGYAASLSKITINPAIAIKVLPSLSFGAGLNLDRVDLDLQEGLSQYPNNDEFRFKGDGYDVGYNVGLLWQPITQLSFGVAAHGETTPHLNGQTLTEINGAVPATYRSATADFTIPFKVEGGISYRPTPKWNIEFDVDYTHWSDLGTVNINQSSSPVPGLIPQTIPLVFNWDSCYYYELGATRYFNSGWNVSAGYLFNQNAVPDAHYFPVVADGDKHFFSAGVGYKGEHFTFDLAYQFGYGPDRTVSGSAVSAAGQSADGTYGYISHAVAVSLGWHF